MSEKVIIPREVADAIERLRLKQYTNANLALLAFRDDPSVGRWTDDAQAIRDYAQENGDDFLRALLDGYKRELTAEESIADIYRNLTEFARMERGLYNGDPARYTVAAQTLKRVLGLLGIEIPGVNAPETEERAHA